jgi:hypothetical protein
MILTLTACSLFEGFVSLLGTVVFLFVPSLDIELLRSHEMTHFHITNQT